MIYNVIMVKRAFTEDYDLDIDVTSFKYKKDAITRFNQLYDNSIDELLPETEKQRALNLREGYYFNDNDFFCEKAKDFAKVSNETFEVIIIIKESTIY